MLFLQYINEIGASSFEREFLEVKNMDGLVVELHTRWMIFRFTNTLGASATATWFAGGQVKWDDPSRHPEDPVVWLDEQQAIAEVRAFGPVK